MNKTLLHYYRLSCRRLSTKVFDTELKSRQRQKAFDLHDDGYYDYLREESATRLVDKLVDIHASRKFPIALEIGSFRGQLFNALKDNNPSGIEHLVQLDSLIDNCDLASKKCNDDNLYEVESILSSHISETMDENIINTYKLRLESEKLPFKPNTFDLIMSSMHLHWINDLPGMLNQIRTILKPDGVFIATLFGGSTLKELRYSFYLAEQERRGGVAPHTSPLVHPSDVAGLSQAAGFALPAVDVDTIMVSYPSALSLMEHLWRMGEGHAALNRQQGVGQDTFLATAALYQELYGLEDGSVPATFEIISLIGWGPDSSQPKACQRGTATHSLKEITKPKP